MRRALTLIGLVRRNRYLLLVFRLLLGATFILAAAGKLPERAEFVEIVTGFGLLPSRLAAAYGSALPWLELVVGSCLVLGCLSRIAAGTSFLMIASFIVANGTAVFKYKRVLYGCCFGDLIPIRTSDALVLDSVIMAMALLVLFNGGGFLSIDSEVWNRLVGRNLWRMVRPKTRE